MVKHNSDTDDVFDPDLRRTSRFAFVGMVFVAPMCHTWFGYLHRMVRGDTLLAALKRVILDQLIFAPIMIPGFMTNIMILEGKSRDEIKRALIRDVPDAYMTNLGIWVPALLVNFRYI